MVIFLGKVRIHSSLRRTKVKTIIENEEDN